MELQFLDYEFGEPKYSEEECRTKDLTFSKPLYVNVELLIKETGEIQRQRVYMGDYPWMTDQGTFVINGAERVVVSQLVRSPGVYYSEARTSRPAGCCSARRSSRTAAPGSSSRRTTRTSCGSRSTASARSRRRPCCAPSATRRTTRSARCSRRSTPTPTIRSSRARSTRTSPRPRPRPSSRSTRSCAPATRPPARTPASSSRACSSTSADTTSVGSVATSSTRSSTASRRAWASSSSASSGPITKEDIAAIVGHLIECNRGLHPKDDIDHLGNRRIRANGELIQNAFRIGLLRMERVVRERMTIQEIDKATPERPHQHPPGRGGDEGVLRRQPAQPVHGPDQPAGRADVEAPAVGASARAACRASAPGSTSATSTTATTAASARSRPRKVRTSA